MRRALDLRSEGRGFGSRWAAVALALAASIALAPAGCRRDEADVPHIDAADLRIDIGVAGAVDSKRWSVLKVKALNRGSDFRGVLEVRGSDDPVVASTPLEIAGKGGAVREVLVPVRPRDWTEVTVTFRHDGWAASFRKDVILSEEVKARVLVVAHRARGLRALEEAIPARPREVKVVPTGDLLP
jgi:hypothetical protein